MIPENIKKRQWIKYNLYFIAEHFLGKKGFNYFFLKGKNRLVKEISQNRNLIDRQKTFTNKDISCSNFEDLIKNRSELMKGPILFKGLAKDWECTKNWNHDYFQKHFSDREVILVGNKGLVDKEKTNKFTIETLSNFIENSKKDITKYLRFSRIVEDNPILRNQIRVDVLERFKNKFSKGGNLYMFMGERGSKTTMHAAIIQSLFIQVKGEKKWTIYPANERIFLDPVADRRPYYYTDANPNNHQDKDYPLLKFAKKYEIILEEGDILWFPSFYWHYVENLSANIGVAYKFTDFIESWKISKVLTTLLFFTTKPTIFEIFLYNIFKKKDLHFDKKF